MTDDLARIVELALRQQSGPELLAWLQPGWDRRRIVHQHPRVPYEAAMVTAEAMWRAQDLERARSLVGLLPAAQPMLIEHVDTEVRLHGGCRHHQTITLPEGCRETRQVMVTCPVAIDWLADETPTAAFGTACYRRHQVAVPDDVEFSMHLYDYWLIQGGRLPLMVPPTG
jgi:hypothetical protein